MATLCLKHGDCTLGFCQSDGWCASKLKPGDPCLTRDLDGCSEGYHCSPILSRCLKLDASTPKAREVVYTGKCESDPDCLQSEECHLGKCRALPKEGESCEKLCADGLQCYKGTCFQRCPLTTLIYDANGGCKGFWFPQCLPPASSKNGVGICGFADRHGKIYSKPWHSWPPLETIIGLGLIGLGILAILFAVYLLLDNNKSASNCSVKQAHLDYFEEHARGSDFALPPPPSYTPQYNIDGRALREVSVPLRETDLPPPSYSEALSRTSSFNNDV